MSDPLEPSPPISRTENLDFSSHANDNPGPSGPPYQLFAPTQTPFTSRQLLRTPPLRPLAPQVTPIVRPRSVGRGERRQLISPVHHLSQLSQLEFQNNWLRNNQVFHNRDPPVPAPEQPEQNIRNTPSPPQDSTLLHNNSDDNSPSSYNLDTLFHLDPSHHHIMKPANISVKPSEYYGNSTDEPQDFIDQFNLASTANRWNEDTKLIQFPSYLRGKALQWYNAASTSRKRLGEKDFTWDELEQEFLNSNGPAETRQDAIEYRLMGRKQGPTEPCYEYLISIENLCNRVDKDMSDKRRIKYALRGLRADVLNTVNTHNPSTVKELAALLSKCDESTLLTSYNKAEEVNELVFYTNNLEGHPTHTKPSPENNASSPTTDLSLVVRRLEKLEKHINSSRRRQPDRRPIYNNRAPTIPQSGQLVPFNNAVVPHSSSREPPRDFRPSNRANKPRSCYHCGSLNHLRPRCPEIQRSLNLPPGERRNPM